MSSELTREQVEARVRVLETCMVDKDDAPELWKRDQRELSHMRQLLATIDANTRLQAELEAARAVAEADAALRAMSAEERKDGGIVFALADWDAAHARLKEAAEVYARTATNQS